MIFYKKVKSKIDNVVKYVFKDTGYLLEFSYINKNDGKHIICVPCQTMCNQRCVFCHTNNYIGKIRTENLGSYLIYLGVKHIIQELELEDSNLLISYMGCGEPMVNSHNVLESIIDLSDKYNFIRFAVATSLPKKTMPHFISFAEKVRDLKLNVKMHFSLHNTKNNKRKEMMPNASLINESILALKLYKEITSCDIEIHYALIKNINDTNDNFVELANLFDGGWADIKFLFYNKRESLDYELSSRSQDKLFNFLGAYNIKSEFYKPPGLDIGASCGQFNLEE